jgi:hypothetical protein
MSDKAIAYTVENNDNVQFFNSAGQLIWATGGTCIAYTANSATIVWCGVRNVYKFTNGTPNLIRSDNV